MECTPLKDLSRNSYRWKVMVRFARIWEFRSADKKDVYTIDFVVVDQQKSTMEGLIPRNRVDQFKDKIKEGSVYIIDKFDLFDPKKNYRSVDNPLRICFTIRTLLTEIVSPPENFPMFAYTALPFNMLKDRTGDIITLSDIVGLVTKVSPILPPSGRAKSHKRHVHITDGRDHAVVTLWGEHADQFDTDGLMALSNEQPVVILFVSMTVTDFSGLLSFMSTSATRWYVNVPIPEIADVRQRASHFPSQIEWHTGKQEQADPIASSIPEIATFEPNDIMGVRYKLPIRITQIQPDQGWQYMSCTKCWKTVKLEDGNYICPRCPTTTPVPRYRFVARAIDPTSVDGGDENFADLYFFGPQGEAAVDKEALTLLTSLRGQTDELPHDLLAIVGKEFNIVATPRRESLDSLHPHLQAQIVEPIFHANVPLQQSSNDPLADQIRKELHTSVTSSQVEPVAGTSTPLSFTEVAPQHLPSPSSSANKGPVDPPARPKQKAASVDKNPRAKKELRFSNDK